MFMKMKKALFTLLGAITSFASIAQNVGIGTTTPNASAQLDVTSTNSGFLPPRMTYAQRNAIVNPAAGLIVYCTDCNGGAGEMNYFNGSTWMNMTVGIASNTVTDLPSVTIGAQVWTTQNLNVSSYRDGTPLPKVEDGATWESLTTGAYCYYNNDSATYAAVYGKLYNWYAVNDPRGLAPIGWHVSTDAEWTTLKISLGANPGAQLKATSGWEWCDIGNGTNGNGTDSSRFAGFPGGFRYYDGYDDFLNFNVSGHWWSSTEYGTQDAWTYLLHCYNFDVVREHYCKKLGLSVRCVRD